MAMVQTGYGDVPWPEGIGTWEIELAEGQSILSPTSTKGKRVFGPERLFFTRRVGGGITMTLAEMGDDFQGGRMRKLGDD